MHGEHQPAQVFDAGEHFIISGYSKLRVDEALNKFAEAGSRVISSATRVSDESIARSEHPQAHPTPCKVTTVAGKQIVTGTDAGSGRD